MDTSHKKGLTKKHVLDRPTTGGKNGDAEKERRRFMQRQSGALTNKYIPKKIYVVDTSALEHSHSVLPNLLQDGENMVIIPNAVWEELDGHKTRSDFRGEIARFIIRRVVDLLREKAPYISLESSKFNIPKDVELDRSKPDHRILLTAIKVKKSYCRTPVILVTKDNNMTGLAIQLGVHVEDVKTDHVEIREEESQEQTVLNVPSSQIEEGTFPVDEDDEKQQLIGENEGVICHSDLYGDDWKSPAFMAIRKGHLFHIVDPGISISGISPESNNGERNWGQYQAIGLLMDPTIHAVTLLGGAGTGKTLLAIAAAIEQRKSYQQILISRAMVPLGNKDRLGFLPGDMNEKMRPWLGPIYDNIDLIKSLNPEWKKKCEEMFASHKISVLEFDQIRGRSFRGRFIIVDEIQNLQPDLVLTIATRADVGTKIVFTGDPGQIDIPWLDKRSNGLSVFTEKMRGHPLFGSVTLEQAIRSPLTQAILDRWHKKE